MGTDVPTDWLARSDNLKDKMPDKIRTNVKLKTIGFGYIVIYGEACALPRPSKRSKPHFNCSRDFQCVFEPMTNFTREEASRVIASHVIANDRSLECKKRD